MIESVGLMIASWLTLTMIGLGITSLILPQREYRGIWVISFWVGVITTAIMGTTLSQMGISTNQSWLVIMIVSLALIWVAKKNHLLSLMPGKDGGGIAILTILVLGIHFFTYLSKTTFPTTVSMGNLDPISYSTVADFLQTNTINEGGVYQDFSPYLWSVGDLLHSSYRWGTPMVLSVLSAIFQVRAYQIFGILITLFFGMSFPMVWLLLKQGRPHSGRVEALILWGVYGINSTLMYTLYNVFFAQFAWGGILILAIYLAGLESTTWLRALTIVGTALVYPEGIIFVLMPSLIRRDFKSWLAAIMIAPYPIFTSIKQVITVMINSSKVTWIGWEPIRYPNMFEVLGLYNLNYSRPIPFYILLLPMLGLLAIMGWGWYRLANRRTILLYGVVFGCAYLATLASGNWFTYFRAITYSIFLYAVIFTAGMGELFAKLKNQYICLILVGVVMGLTIRSGVRTAKQMYYHHHTVDAALISLAEVPRNGQLISTADLYLGEYNLWVRLWREYMLMGEPLMTRQNWTTDNYKLSKLEQVLVESDKKGELEGKIELKEKTWSNKYYEIYAVDVKVDQI